MDKANPIGLISSVALMLRYSFNLHKEAGIIERAIDLAIEKGYRTEDIFSKGTKLIGTQMMGNVICDCINELSSVNKVAI